MDSAEGYRLMDRLGAFSARPVVDVRLVRAVPVDEPDLFENRFDPLPPEIDAAAAGGDPDSTDSTDPTDPSNSTDAAAPPHPHRRPLASMLRVDQMRGENDVAATVTYFHLLTNAGCWWMRF
jgi:hypothetical protein